MAEYIERDKILGYMDLVVIHARGVAGNDSMLKKVTDIVENMRNLVAEAPAEDVVPVVHGRWMEVPYVYIGLKRYECSNCYSDVFWNDRIQHHKDKYCPNCGARMDG